MSSETMWLQKNKINEIDWTINKILNSVDKSYPENNILEIVEALGITVSIADLDAVEKGLNGVVDIDEKKIYLNSNYSNKRRTFTLAHELGHFCLHKGMKFRMDRNNLLDNKEDQEEMEADYFAGSLLMPKHKLLPIINEITDYEAIASYFGVSTQALLTRIKWLRREV